MTAPDIVEEMRETTTSLGLRVRRVMPLTLPDPRKRGRSTWRVDLRDGGSLKARRLESAEAAQELVRLRDGLEPAFARVVACRGPVLVEEWIEGEPLAGPTADERAGEAGVLLGRLHRTPITSVPGESRTVDWRAQADGDLDALRAAGALDNDEVDALREELRRHDPGRARGVLIHRDFCAENMLLDGAARLRVIDNEWFTIGPAELDLGRTLQRWPLSGAARREFLDAYRTATGTAHGPLDFWTLIAALLSARARLGQLPDRLEAVRRLVARRGAAVDAP